MVHVRMVATVALVLVSLAGPAHAGKLGRLKPAAKPTPLLGGRLSIKVPAAARIQARQRSIMAAPESAASETRVVLDAGKERLVIMTNELFALSGPDFGPRAGKHLRERVVGPAAGAAKVRRLKQGKGKLSVFALTPAKHDLKRQAILVLAGLAAHPDGTVQQLAFFVNPAGARDLAGVTRLCQAMLKTLRPGKRTLKRTGGERSLRAAGASLAMVVPEDHVLISQRGPDFMVHRLAPLVPLGSPGGRIGVYVGGHPGLQYRQRENRSMGKWKASVKKVKRTLLGKPVQWHHWSHRGWHTAEALAPLTRRDRVHVFVGGPSEAAVGKLLKTAQTLRKAARR